jgi:hypothetical protein
MPATHEPVITKRAERQSLWLSVPHPSVTLMSYFGACIRADLSFSLLQYRRASDTTLIPLFSSTRATLSKRSPAESVKCKLYFSYAGSVVAAAIIDINSYSRNSR